MIWRLAKRVFAVSGLLVAVVMGLGLLYLQTNGAKLLSVQSGSMAPALHKGDLVVVRPVPKGQLAVGDVVTFINPANSKQTITHRVAALPADKSGMIVAKGDANAAPDKPVPVKAVLGKVARHAPVAGWAIDLVRQPIGLIIIIYLPAIVIVTDEWRRLTRYYRKQRPYRVPGRTSLIARLPHPHKTAMLIKGVGLTLVAAVLCSVPTFAFLSSSATLTDSSLSITAPANNANHVLFRKIEFECSASNSNEPSNSNELSKLLAFSIHNSSNIDVDLDGWYVESSEGRVLTISRGTPFRPGRLLTREVRLGVGVHYRGDFLALHKATGELVDALSWGTDTTYFNPTLPALSPNTTTQFTRTSLTDDTDTMLDWSILSATLE
jgi:signal peptidase I